MQRIVLVAVVAVVVLGAVAPVGAAAQSDDGGTDDAAQVECSFPVTATDGTGTEITLAEEPETIVTLNPSPAQTIWEIGAEEKVIGLTEHAENLEGAGERTSVSTDAKTIDPERVVDLDADLVLATSSQYVTEELIESLREADQTVYYFPAAESIDDVRERTRFVGQLVGDCEGAAETVAWMDEELATVAEAIEGEERPDVLYTFFGHTAGSETFIHELIEAGGGTNVAAEVGIEEYPAINEETVIQQNPEWIVTNTNSPEVPDSPAYGSTTAVQEDQVLTVNINHLNRPGPRVVHAVSTFAETFHPEAYAEAADESDANASTSAGADDEPGTGTDDESEAGADDEPGESAESASTDEIPGFGVGPAVAAVAALLAVVGAATYRQDRRGP